MLVANSVLQKYLDVFSAFNLVTNIINKSVVSFAFGKSLHEMINVFLPHLPAFLAPPLGATFS